MIPSYYPSFLPKNAQEYDEEVRAGIAEVKPFLKKYEAQRNFEKKVGESISVSNIYTRISKTLTLPGELNRGGQNYPLAGLVD